MKALLLSTVLVASAAFAQNKPMMTDYKIDSAKTTIDWVGKKVTGQHNGKMKVEEGSLQFTGPALTGGTIVVDMNSMTVEDITSAEYSEKFITHMKSPDFFDTAKFPKAILAIKSSKPAGKDLEVTGDLTILGQTKPITFKVTDWKWTDKTASGKSRIVVDRTNWGIKYGSSSFFKSLGDKAIDNDFTLDIALSANR